MNILVLGNGFDIAHNLPTGYKDFLRFTDVFNEFKGTGQILLRKTETEWEREKEERLVEYIKELFDKAATNDYFQNLINEIEMLIFDNQWIEHFKIINIAQGWVDFESEISKVIQTLDTVRIKTITGIANNSRGEKLTHYERQILIPFFGQGSSFTSLEPIDKRKERMLNDLKRLTRCLEIYLCDYVEKIPIDKKLPDLDGLDIHAVVSFNYTDTYRKNYCADPSNGLKCDFIHGKADVTHDINTCNMVIGIDEYLEGAAKEKDNEYIQFKKFFQRIYKATGCDYVEWLEAIKPRPEQRYNPHESNVYIYGHSLDATDKDILGKLITAEKVKTTIFYHSKDALEKQIINLVKVITEEELIRRTGEKTIIFKKTQA